MKTEDEILTVLLDCDGNSDQAIEALLSEKPVVAAVATPAKKVEPPVDTEKDELLAVELQKALQEADEQRRKTQQYDFPSFSHWFIYRMEDEAKAQAEIIKILLEEKQQAEKKTSELSKMTVDLDKLYLAGEREALESNTYKKFELFPQRSYENDAGSVHFRTAGITDFFDYDWFL